MKFKWTGLRPLLMHNGSLADPISDATVAMAKLIKDRKASKKDADKAARLDAEIARIEWEFGLYWNEKLGPVILSDAIERCIQLGAQKEKLGKQAQAGALCVESDIKLNYDGPRTKEALYKEKRFCLRKGVVIQRNRVMRSRPMFPTGWWIEFDMEVDTDTISEEAMQKACEDAGRFIGLCDWRPKFGRFISERIS